MSTNGKGFTGIAAVVSFSVAAFFMFRDEPDHEGYKQLRRNHGNSVGKLDGDGCFTVEPESDDGIAVVHGTETKIYRLHGPKRIDCDKIPAFKANNPGTNVFFSADAAQRAADAINADPKKTHVSWDAMKGQQYKIMSLKHD